jgi:hypothetical protein
VFLTRCPRIFTSTERISSSRTFTTCSSAAPSSASIPACTIGGRRSPDA